LRHLPVIKGQPADPGSPEKIAVKRCVCVCVCYCVAEIPSVPDLRREGDGEHVHRGVEIHRQSSDGKPRGRARGKGWQWRLEILAHQIQAVQQVCNWHCYYVVLVNILFGGGLIRLL